MNAWPAPALDAATAVVVRLADLVGVLDNVTDTVRANMELFQLSGTSLQTPCATPGMR